MGLHQARAPVAPVVRRQAPAYGQVVDGAEHAVVGQPSNLRIQVDEEGGLFIVIMLMLSPFGVQIQCAIGVGF